MSRDAASSNRVVEPIPRRADQLVGRRLIAQIEEHLWHLRTRPAHGNRTFFYDQLVVAHLLAFFNPALHSLRRIEDVFGLPGVQRRLGMPAAPKSTVADAQRLFDPELLKPILEDLKGRLKIQPHDARLDDLTRQLTAVDGTFFAVAGRIAWPRPPNAGPNGRVPPGGGVKKPRRARRKKTRVEPPRRSAARPARRVACAPAADRHSAADKHRRPELAARPQTSHNSGCPRN